MPHLLDASELSTALSSLPGWTGDRDGIHRTVEFADFTTAINAVDAAAAIAEQTDHHPDIDIRWRSVTFACVTHSEGGVTDADIELAGRIDGVVAGQPLA